MSKTFTFAGRSTLNGVVAYRFANDANRVKVLAKNGHTDIDLRELPQPMSKEQAIQFLNEHEIFADGNRVTQKAATAPQAEAPVADDDGFVEPKDERIQVAMTRAAREYPGLSAQQLYETVMLTHKHFGDTEPNF